MQGDIPTAPEWSSNTAVDLRFRSSFIHSKCVGNSNADRRARRGGQLVRELLPRRLANLVQFYPKSR